MNLLALQEYDKFVSKTININSPIINLSIDTYVDEDTYQSFVEYKGQEVYIPSKNIISAINYILAAKSHEDLTKEVYEISINKAIESISGDKIANIAINYINSILDYKLDYASITSYDGKLNPKLINAISKYGQVKFLAFCISKDINHLLSVKLINDGEIEYINDTCYGKIDLIDILSTTKMELDTYTDSLLNNNEDAVNELSYDDGIAKFLINMNNAVHERRRAIC